MKKVVVWVLLAVLGLLAVVGTRKFPLTAILPEEKCCGLQQVQLTKTDGNTVACTVSDGTALDGLENCLAEGEARFAGFAGDTVKWNDGALYVVYLGANDGANELRITSDGILYYGGSKWRLSAGTKTDLLAMLDAWATEG